MRRLGWVGLGSLLLVSLALVTVGKEMGSPFVEMEVKGISLDSLSQAPVVLLSDREGERGLPIWIGLPEATAMEKELQSITSARPMTHDLLYSILGQAQVKVKEVRIVSLKDRTYYARLFLISNKNLIEVDARPSDAIILAMKSKAPILVASKILEEQGIPLSHAVKPSTGERHGIRVQELTPALSSHFNFKGEKGVLVSDVLPGSAAETAGIKAGDIITKVSHKPVGNVQQFDEVFETIKAGGETRILLFRENRLQEITFRLKP